MKTRHGFVSNSSSSSFIVSVKKGTKPIVSFDVDLTEFGKVIKTEKELKAFWKSYYYASDEIELAEDSFYQSSLKEIKNGRYVVIGQFSDNGTGALETFLCDAGIEAGNYDKKNMTVIENEAGY